MRANTNQIADPDILSLIRELYPYAIRVVSEDNEAFFQRISKELPIKLYRYPSGSTFNGWVVPELWKVVKATISRNGRTVFDGSVHPLAVATYSRPFQGELDYEELQPHMVTNPELPQAYVYHCVWQYRPWEPDWAFSVPYEVYKTLGPGRYQVDLVTTYEPGEMLVGEYEHRGRSDRTVVFNAHTCHPLQANDDLAGVAALVRLFQWLRGRDTHYTYRLVLAPEHVGTVFYLAERSEEELQRLVCGAFAEMPGTDGPIKVASSFLGDQPMDKAFRNAVRHHSNAYEQVPWREGAGNDETVWEAPGYEVPFVEVSRCLDSSTPYREYHTSLDTPDILNEEALAEFYRVFSQVVEILENNATLYRRFNGLISLSNPEYDLYFERPDPAVAKDLDADSEKWGHLLDSLFRYLDGSMTILDIADKHDLPFDRLFQYLTRFQDKGLVDLKFAPVERLPVSQIVRTPEQVIDKGRKRSKWPS